MAGGGLGQGATGRSPLRRLAYPRHRGDCDHRDDSLTLKVLAEEGAEGKIKLVGRWILRQGSDVYRPDSQLRVAT